MKIRGFANRPTPTPEKNSGVRLVETAGYIPASKRIRQMVDAGIRLEQARAEQYDTDNLDDEPDINPWRSRGLDCTDAYLLLQQAKRVVVQVKDYIGDSRKKRVVTPSVSHQTNADALGEGLPPPQKV